MSSPIRTERRGATPTEIHIGYLKHIKRRDAVARVQGLVRRLALAPEVTGWRIEKTPEGYAYEIQEGGSGRPYLPVLLKRLREAPEEPVHLLAGDRVVRVTGPVSEIRSVTLPEGDRPALDAITPRGKLQPFMPTSTGALITASIFFSTAAASFLIALTLAGEAREAWRDGAAAAASTTVEMLPLSHWPETPPPGEYVTRVQLAGDHWTTQTEKAPSARPDRRAGVASGELPQVETRPVGARP